ncbi:hypothetical protein [Ammoniphilus sp. 3BR4]|uniref:hypothetical protein n=1 Tax=Ammoniphilus sp. 3BR4 TaxID=3158265 RepID=UPI003466C5BC
MNEQLKGFLHDLVFLLHEKYNDTLQNNEKETENGKRIFCCNLLGGSLIYTD